MQRTAYTARLWIVTFIVKINPCESHKTDAKCIAEQWDEWISDVDKADNLLVSDIISKEGGSLIVTYKGEPDKITVTSDDLTKWGVVTNLHLDHPRMWRSIDKRSYFAPAVAFFATKCASRKV